MLLRSLFVTFFALIYSAICPRLRKYYNAGTLYKVWIILMFAFIVPSVPLTFSETAHVPILSDTANFILGTEHLISNEYLIVNSPNKSNIGYYIITIIWSIGVVISLVRSLMNHYRFTVMLKKTSVFKYVTKDGLLLMTNPLISTPLLYGLITPIIVIPDNVFESEALPMVIEHETIHWKRNDVYIKFILMIIQAAHWFNPFMNHLLNSMSTQCEISCDSEVVRDKEKKLRYNYGETIIRIATKNDKMVETHAAAFGNGKKYIKKRLVNIIDDNYHERKSKILILCSVVILLFSVFLLSSTYAEKSVEFGTLTIELPNYWDTDVNPQTGILNIRCGPLNVAEVCVLNGKNIIYSDNLNNFLLVKNKNTYNVTTMVNQVITWENLMFNDQFQFVHYDEYNNCTYLVNLSSAFFDENSAYDLAVNNVFLHK